jgi:hypothetical protein
VTVIFTLRGNLYFHHAFAVALWSKLFELQSALIGHGDAGWVDYLSGCSAYVSLQDR